MGEGALHKCIPGIRFVPLIVRESHVVWVASFHGLFPLLLVTYLASHQVTTHPQVLPRNYRDLIEWLKLGAEFFFDYFMYLFVEISGDLAAGALDHTFLIVEDLHGMLRLGHMVLEVSEVSRDRPPIILRDTKELLSISMTIISHLS